MKNLTETLFEQAMAAQDKYDIQRELYGLQSSSAMAALFRYETLHDVIELSGLMPEYLAYYRELRNTAKNHLEDITMLNQNEPDLSSLPEICYTVTPTGVFAMLRRGESGYYPVDTEAAGAPDLRELADKLNRQFGISKAQEAAMLNGSMFGWDTPAADPNSYDSNGIPILLQQASY